MNRHAVLLALASAALFGVSTPAAKALLGEISPTILAGLFYCGAGVGIALLRRAKTNTSADESLGRKDLPWLGAAIVSGGIIGPLLLMSGLSMTDAAEASLLLTLEGVATALIGWFVFRENFDARVALGMVFLAAGALTLAWTRQPSFSGVLGPLAIAGACVAWGLDNNLTRKVSLSDPLQIVQIKGLLAGPFLLALGLLTGAVLPNFTTATVAGVIGFLGYGVSLALFVRSLRELGAARTGAYFSTAPFLGAAAAILFLGEPLTLQLLAAGGLMALGVWLHLTEHHEHEHEHEALEHAHAHIHDEHHQHEHLPDDPPGEPHTHAHRHANIRHRHPHMPDMHHQHRH